MRKDFSKSIYEKIEKQLDRFMIIGASVSLIVAFALYFSSIPKAYLFADLFIALILIVFIVYKNRIPIEAIFIVVITINIALGIFVFFNAGFSSGFIMLIYIGNLVAILLFSKNKSLLVNVISIIIFFLLGVYANLYSNNVYIDIGAVKWISQFLMFSLFLILLRFTIYSIIDSLLGSMETIKDNNMKIYKLAYYDQLTKLPNQNSFKKQIVEKSKEVDSGFIVIFYIKNLNLINFIYGSNMGDLVLKKVAVAFEKLNKESYILARTAGNEFSLWIENKKERNIIDYLKRVNEFFDKEFKVDYLDHQLDIYVSYAKYEANKINTLECYDKSNIAMTYLKTNSKIKTIKYNSDLERLVKDTEQMKNLLNEAIDNKEFTIHYQSKILTSTSEVIGAEALARWESPIIGNISPIVFIPEIEKMNKAVQFGELIIDKVFSEYKDLCSKYNKEMRVSINISPTHLMNEHFLEYLEEKIKEYKIKESNIIIEITEEVLIRGIEKVNRVLSEIRNLNINVSIDDFGTGYSSFSYLESLKVDELKIDKSFIDKICKGKRTEIVVENIIFLAKKLGFNTVAEGVETKEQYNKLSNLNCDIIQGYYFSKPEPI